MTEHRVLERHRLEGEERAAALDGLLSSRALIESTSELVPGLAPPAPVQVYALLDGARVPDLLTGLAARGADGPCCLYSGELSEEEAALAPYLVPVVPGTDLAAWLGGSGWGDHWGVYLLSPARPEQLAQHLRSFLRVSGPDGGGLGFRFYDPRVLRPFLEALDPHQTATFFGGIRCGSPDAPEASFRQCPLCARPQSAPRRSCVGCKALFAGPPEGPYLISSVLLEGELPAEAIHCRPATQALPSPEPEGEPLARPPVRLVPPGQRGPLLLELHQEQLDALSADFQRRKLRAWLLDHVQRVFPAKCARLDPEALLERVVQGQRRAEGHGLVEDAHVARFVDVLFLWHPEFDLHEGGPFRGLLEDPGLEPADKAEKLWATAREVTSQVLARRAARGGSGE